MGRRAVRHTCRRAGCCRFTAIVSILCSRSLAACSAHTRLCAKRNTAHRRRLDSVMEAGATRLPVVCILSHRNQPVDPCTLHERVHLYRPAIQPDSPKISLLLVRHRPHRLLLPFHNRHKPAHGQLHGQTKVPPRQHWQPHQHQHPCSRQGNDGPDGCHCEVLPNVAQVHARPVDLADTCRARMRSNPVHQAQAVDERRGVPRRDRKTLRGR
ncbi:hypothetical protein BC831DRAFT_129641 [Entophlyctis helioformis]|nr:hypothetical protein BC831DRAFT_129641 [Entophlyctis helioformis]